MNESVLTVPNWLSELAFEDLEAECRPSVSEGVVDDAREWLAAILIEVTEGLVPHIRYLEQVYQGHFRAPLSRCLVLDGKLEWTPPDVRFRHRQLLNNQQLSILAQNGLAAFKDPAVFPGGECVELARLLLNPYALFDLSDFITFSCPAAWVERLEKSGIRLMSQFGIESESALTPIGSDTSG